MRLNADLTACAALVERADPLRFRLAMRAPLDARKRLFALYAFNAEVARAPWVTQEPMIAEMRLQWWRDVCTEIQVGKTPRRHEVVTPLAQMLSPQDAAQLETLVAARRWDIYRDPFEDAAHFERYIDQTAGTLMWVAARGLGQADETTVRHCGYAAGIAAWLVAIPALEAKGRVPLIDGTPGAVALLAETALSRLKQARSNRASVSPAARPALYAATYAVPILKAAAQNPEQVANGTLPALDASASLSVTLRHLWGRW